jgi:hypothetical protein
LDRAHSAVPTRMVAVANEASEIVLSMEDLREVTNYTADSAQVVLESSREHTRPTPDLGTRSTPHGLSLEVANAGRPCATPRGRRRWRPETQTPRPRGRRRTLRCWRHPLRTCIHWPTRTR